MKSLNNLFGNMLSIRSLSLYQQIAIGIVVIISVTILLLFIGRASKAVMNLGLCNCPSCDPSENTDPDDPEYIFPLNSVDMKKQLDEWGWDMIYSIVKQIKDTLIS